MGTGILSILLHQIPYQFPGLGIISVVAWVLNVVIFLVLSAGSIARYIMWPHLFVETMRHPVLACYWYEIRFECIDGRGSFSLGFSTIVSMLCYVAVPVWGNGVLIFTEILFWINVVVALLICFSIILLMYISPSLNSE